jgi:dipeptidyl aminopeptidase/acylaminoacyl peptidase
MLLELGLLPLKAADMYLKKPKSTTTRVPFGEHPRQYVLYALPPEQLERKKTWIMFFHGGGWQFGKPGMLPQLADFFLASGYPVLLPAYRLTPRFSFPDMREDLTLALLKSVEIIQKTVGADEKIILGGMSAGANLAAHLLFNTEELAKNHVSPTRFSGFLCCGGPLDLNHLRDTFPLRRFTGGPHFAAGFQAANPINLLSAQSPAVPALFIHGTEDRIVPYPASVSFFKKYKNIGTAELITLPEKQHLDAIRWINDDVETAEKVKKWLESTHRY